MIPSITQIAQSERIGEDQAEKIFRYARMVVKNFGDAAYSDDPDVIAAALYPDPKTARGSRRYVRRAVKILQKEALA